MPPLRPLAFNILFYLNTALHMLLCLPLLAFPRRLLWRACGSWNSVNHWLLRTICGISFEIRGRENIPKGPLLIACKHQSAWETYALLGLFSDPLFILKRELMWLPVFGWYCLKAGMVPVRRGGGKVALEDMIYAARLRIEAGRQIIIFPEGTRRAPDDPPVYKQGVARLYEKLNVPCLPIALNSGVYWPRRNWNLVPGTIRVEIMEPIAPGMHGDAFFARLQNAIEPASTRLVAEARNEIAALRKLEERRALLRSMYKTKYKKR